MDYKEIGFMCGIEIHQQLAGKKLFCDCAAINSTKKPDIQISRRLRAVAGETGKVDVAASHEMKKDKEFIYVSNSEDTCLVEFDEEPPHPMNKDALATVIEVCQLLNAKIVDNIQVMRKTVVDGSNVSGFQRTALVGIDGYVETSQGKVRIPNICIEEEAAQKYGESKDSLTYKLDRLGITLIEIATEPDIVSPEHAKETAEKIGQILRSTGKVKRGLGTIRQDVNVSIKGGNRVEIKGFQDLKSIPKVIVNEIKRHQKLISQNKKIPMEVRKAEKDFSTSFLRPMPGAARMYPETDIEPIKPMIKKLVKREMIFDKIKRFSKDYKLSNDLSKAIAKSEKADLFETIIKKNSDLKPAYIAETLVSYSRELIRDFKPCDPTLITQKMVSDIFDELGNGNITKEIVMGILVDISKGKKLNFDNYKIKLPDNFEKDVEKIVKSNKGAPFGAVMGEVMKKYRGQVDGKILSELVKKFL
jgi:Glu-tRNA(Gln) amidotransferase subunit E-like FAD-binding protein